MTARFATKLLLLMLALPAIAQSGLNKKEFNKYWRIESEAPDYQVSFSGDTCEVTAPKGLTLWRKQPFTANTIVEYDATVMDRTVDVNILRIRKKIEPYSSCIGTKMGYGYYFKD